MWRRFTKKQCKSFVNYVVHEFGLPDVNFSINTTAWANGWYLPFDSREPEKRPGVLISRLLPLNRRGPTLCHELAHHFCYTVGLESRGNSHNSYHATYEKLIGEILKNWEE